MAQNDYTYGEYTPISQRRPDSEIARAIARYRAQQAQEAAAVADQLAAAEQNGGQRFTRDGQEIIVSNRPQNRRQRGNAQQQQGLFGSVRGATQAPQQALQQAPQAPPPPQQQEARPDYDVDTYRAEQNDYPATGQQNTVPAQAGTDYPDYDADAHRESVPSADLVYFDDKEYDPSTGLWRKKKQKGLFQSAGQQNTVPAQAGTDYPDYDVDTYRQDDAYPDYDMDEIIRLADLVYYSDKEYDPSTGQWRKKNQKARPDYDRLYFDDKEYDPSTGLWRKKKQKGGSR